MLKKIAAFVMIFALIATPVFAGGDYAADAMDKLGFGLKNVLLGWTEIFTEPVGADNIVAGVATGVANAVGNTVGGALHVVTFLCPNIDIPLPDGGIDLL